ncbi:translocase [Rhodospirillum rubrum]|uniref:Tim44/TimA family putative adaptor protein n=1 Tax=Rhodospirillum rubrum TaxID=1085 RepID=UPI00190841C4|nr:Tim44/TimA family putative adaptor protein [Rhodospirillum rubrum]MBK1663214.1 translocase [Rhodospirillum rubrum]MBK1676957.1 translocase [Rhodospirillum rubrum]
MNEGFQYIDIIFFAMIAAFLVLRLRSVLGRRTGEEQRRPDPFAQSESAQDNVIDLSDRKAVAGRPGDGTLAGGLTQIQLTDPSFSPEGFLIGAKAAFEMILMAYAKGDKAVLKPLLAGEVFQNFSRAIDEREQAEETMETDLVGFKSVEILRAGMDGQDALVTVKFVTEQVNSVRDKSDTVVDGNPNQVEEVTDIWTFRRDTVSNDPNWDLIATQVPEE